LQQVVGYLRYTGRDANIVEEAALDPKPPSAIAHRSNSLAVAKGVSEW